MDAQNQQNCHVGRTRPKVSTHEECTPGERCHWVPIIGFPAEACTFCNRTT